jgi:hypothetical protein
MYIVLESGELGSELTTSILSPVVLDVTAPTGLVPFVPFYPSLPSVTVKLVFLESPEPYENETVCVLPLVETDTVGVIPSVPFVPFVPLVPLVPS